MTEKYFMSYCGSDFIEKYDGRKTDDTLVPAHVFETPDVHDILWAIDLNIDDPAESFTKMLLTAANNAAFLIIFTATDYRKINKLEWEKQIAHQNGGYLSCFDYIDDMVPDKCAEYIVPTKNIQVRQFFSPALLLGADVKTGPYSDFSNFSNNVLPLFIAGYDKFRDDMPGSDVFDSVLFDVFDVVQTIMPQYRFIAPGIENISEYDEYRLQVGRVMQAFTAIMPFVLMPLINNYRAKEDKTPITIISSFDQYLSLRLDYLMRIHLKASNFFNSGCEGGIDVYDDIFNMTYTYFDHQKLIKFLHAQQYVGRNDPCPCGSGKKFKNCCGKRTR